METWKSVVGFEGLYDVSSEGRVRSVARRGVSVRARCRKTTTLTGGYQRIVLLKNGKRYNKMVHRLVIEAFRGPRDDGALVRHLDGSPGNNRLENLEWGSHLENQRDRKIHGTAPAGENNGNAVLTVIDVKWIRERRSSGASLDMLASDFGVTKTLISKICLGKCWTEAGGPIQRYFDVNNSRKVTRQQEQEIIERRSRGETLKSIAESYGISLSGVAAIVKRGAQ